MLSESFPQLRRTGDVTQLFVDGNPFLALGGELGNSNASNLLVLEAALDKCRRMHLNTVMLPVYWDLIESEEGRFDFTLVQGAIDLARARGLRLVYLWFGTWKNSMSCYAPSWVKRDTGRFPRVRRSTGEVEEIISPACTEAAAVDARAFATLMRWTREYDAGTHTVIMAQVENEVGMIPEARDYSSVSEAAYRAAVPEQLVMLLTQNALGEEVQSLWERAGKRPVGTWRDVFGSGSHADEVFSAWSIARFVETVAAAGEAEYPLPMFANAALIRPGYEPGRYPSAGPLPHLLEVWRAAAPSLEMICPDIYFPNFMEWCRRYRRSDNPLFIPEMAASHRAPANAVYATGQCGAIGVGPFSIENVDAEKEANIADCYSALSELSERILAAQAERRIVALSPQIHFDWSVDVVPQRATIDGIVFEAKFESSTPTSEVGSSTLPTLGTHRWDAPPGTPLGAVLILQESDDQFLMLGRAATINFADASGGGRVGIDRVEELRGAGDWTGRWLNGDETHQGRHVHFPDGRWSILRVTLYRYG